MLPMAQTVRNLEPINQAVVIGQMDKEDDRFMLEVTLAEFFTERNVKVIPSLNVLKQGAELPLLLSDSMQQVLAQKNVNTYIICRVRGYDRKFKASTTKPTFEEALNYGSLFSLYREELVNISFEFFIYQNGQLTVNDIVRCANVSSRDKVLIRLKKKLDKKYRKW